MSAVRRRGVHAAPAPLPRHWFALLAAFWLYAALRRVTGAGWFRCLVGTVAITLGYTVVMIAGLRLWVTLPT